MNKKSIIFIIIAIVLVIVGFSAKDTSNETDVISDAIYVADGKVLPENEGKVVIVPGELKVVTPLVDTLTGVELPGVIAKRTVERYEMVSNSDEEETHYTLEWKHTILGDDNEFNNLVSSMLIADAMVGEFMVDKIALHHVNVGKQFSEFDTQALYQRGYILHPHNSFYYISKLDFMPEDGMNLNASFTRNGFQKIYYRDFENIPRISYTVQRSETNQYTFIGRQQNGKIVYDKELGMQSAFDGLMNPEQLAENVESGGMTGAIVAWVIAAFFVLLAVLGMKKKKEN